MKKCIGVLYDWFETGTEGIIWVLLENGKDGYDAMQIIRAGDHLKIYNKDGSILFNGVIDPDYEAGLTPSQLSPGHIQPSALGYWIHWTQRGWNPDDWARLFIRKKDEERLQAELTKY